MNVLWFSVILPLAITQAEFGTPYLRDSLLCAQWNCLNEHLGLYDNLPPREQYTTILQGLLPAGPWQDAVGPALDTCYGDRPRRYTNSCPGQELMHCVVDQLIQNCPAESWRKEHACAPISCLSGTKYMFSQSRYKDIEINLPSDRRPAWFLNNYFNVKCCDLPPLFNDTLLSQCGFSSIIHYYEHRTRTQAPTHTFKVDRKPTDNGNVVQVVPFEDAPSTTIIPHIEDYGEYDPLDCCDISEFIAPTWRSDCGFELDWDSATRLSIKNTTGPEITTTTEVPKSLKNKDVKMVPHSCEQNNCVFKALNIVSESGDVNIEAYKELLNNFTDTHPAWSRAADRVVTKCLRRPIMGYDYDCQINKILACTFDTLSENCPNSIFPDVCGYSHRRRNEAICQISSSRFSPRHRRLFCALPSLTNHEVLSQCNMNSLISLEYVNQTHFTRRLISKSVCKESTPSTTCLLKKMGVMTKYNFMDYFKMKNRIRTHSHGEWYPYSLALTAVFQTGPFYKDHCSTPQKLLNVIDTMLMICPHSKRRNTPQCNKLFSDLTSNVTKNGSQNEELMKQFAHILVTNKHLDIGLLPGVETATFRPFDFSMFNLYGTPPPVQILDLGSRPKTEKPLVLLPVYQRIPIQPLSKDQIWRGGPIKPNSL